MDLSNIVWILIIILFFALTIFRAFWLKQSINLTWLKDLFMIVSIVSGISILLETFGGISIGLLDYKVVMATAGLATILFGIVTFRDEFFSKKERLKGKRRMKKNN